QTAATTHRRVCTAIAASASLRPPNEVVGLSAPSIEHGQRSLRGSKQPAAEG
ncbi:MAG: hypothetical protein H7246_09155, partial [Phycisphaerae bacterium]|nr:hypothetical protein [Saprospiraceae bacterium]